MFTTLAVLAVIVLCGATVVGVITAVAGAALKAILFPISLLFGLMQFMFVTVLTVVVVLTVVPLLLLITILLLPLIVIGGLVSLFLL